MELLGGWIDRSVESMNRLGRSIRSPDELIDSSGKSIHPSGGSMNRRGESIDSSVNWMNSSRNWMNPPGNWMNRPRKSIDSRDEFIQLKVVPVDSAALPAGGAGV